MIKLQNVNKYFNKGKKNQIHVINETSLDLGTTGLVALLGPSGSGKTTLLNAIGGLDKVNRGDIFVNGQRVTGKGAAKVDKIRNLNIGYIFQDYKLIENMTVYENVAIPLRMLGIKDEEEIKKRITYVLETLGIYRYRNRMAGMLSGGERQRVGIARAIAKNPKIIIADEPTGNLDSANSIEIMNIIKAISRDRLVVLVTHEVELAKFYASRIIELQDGKVLRDYQNAADNNLDYRIDNKVYLRDFEKQEKLSSENLKVNFYGTCQDKIDIDIVIKNGNIYIKSRDDQRVEVIDKGSAIELIDDHYKEIDKTLYEEYQFNFDQVADGSIIEKYSSIIGFLPSFLKGFKKIMAYPVMKKLLFIGFLLAGMFITYSFSSIYAGFDIKDKDFIQSNRDYLSVNMPKVQVEDYLTYEALPEVEYMLPGESLAAFDFKLDFYYQSSYAQTQIKGSLTHVSRLEEGNLICGRMPENVYEIVVDKLSLDRMFEEGSAKMVGISTPEQMIGQKVYVNNLSPFTIVGVTNLSQPVIYVSPHLITDILYNGRTSATEDYMDMEEAQTTNILNYANINKEYTLKKGSYPEGDYETIVPYSRAEEYKLNKEIDTQINGRKLKVVGYYESTEDLDFFLVNQNTIKYSVISTTEGFTVCPAGDKEAALSVLREAYNLNVKDSYLVDKDRYTQERSAMVKSTIIMSLIILAISLIEILLMMRSSFLSRIKEIGILRAIGVKKTDIYKMFLGEITAITTIGSLTGIVLMSYALGKLSKITYLSTMFAMNPVVFFGAVIVVYLFNGIVGLIPVYNTMRKTPAAILARQDVD